MCGTELTKMESGCTRCLSCHPITKPTSAPPKKENPRVDVPWTEERIRSIVQDELENWHKTTTVHTEKKDLVLTDVAIPADMDWRAKAKKLGIPLAKETGGARKKVDVLADIKSAEADDN
jgi:hypothetical protein